VSPTSRDPAKRAKQLANLRPAPPAPAGNALARRHGGYAVIVHERLEAKALEVFDALAADAPLRGPTGDLPAPDVAQVRLLAEALCRLDTVSADVSAFGLLEQRGKRRGQVRPAAELEGRLRREVADHLDALGMTPKSRARLGLDLQRSFDLAAHWAQESETDDG